MNRLSVRLFVPYDFVVIEERNVLSNIYIYIYIYIYIIIVPCWRYLLGLPTTPISCLQSFIADSTSLYYNHSLLSILTL
jgi:hypothetical protein